MWFLLIIPQLMFHTEELTDNILYHLRDISTSMNISLYAIPSYRKKVRPYYF